MKISILINHYNEGFEILSNLLKSIELQVGIDFENDIEVLICSDGFDNVLSEDDLNDIQFPIKYFAKEHSGVCTTRNVLLDSANGDYVMFCDSDDMFIRIDALYNLIPICCDNYDVVVSSFYEQAKNGDIVQRDYDRYFLHGKLFNVKYLKNNGIRFNEQFKYSGDPWFINLAMQLSSKCRYVRNPFYIWRNNTNSITRKNRLHYYEEYDLHIKCDMLLIEEYLKRNRLRLAQYTATFLFITAYFDMTSSKWYEMTKESQNRIEKYFKEVYNKYSYLFNDTDDDTINKLYIKRYGFAVMHESPEINITFKTWLSQFENKEVIVDA